jgi:hypothetical protein
MVGGLEKNMEIAVGRVRWRHHSQAMNLLYYGDNLEVLRRHVAAAGSPALNVPRA